MKIKLHNLTMVTKPGSPEAGLTVNLVVMNDLIFVTNFYVNRHVMGLFEKPAAMKMMNLCPTDDFTIGVFHVVRKEWTENPLT